MRLQAAVFELFPINQTGDRKWKKPTANPWAGPGPAFLNCCVIFKCDSPSWERLFLLFVDGRQCAESIGRHRLNVGIELLSDIG
jgi:hypothetical protein